MCDEGLKKVFSFEKDGVFSGHELNQVCDKKFLLIEDLALIYYLSTNWLKIFANSSFMKKCLKYKPIRYE